MQQRYLPKLDPDTAYITNDLLLPKSGINADIVKVALTFDTGQEEVIIDDATGEAIGTRKKDLILWDETDTHLIVPRHFLEEKTHKEFDFEFVDLRPEEFHNAGLKDKITLRDEAQKSAFVDLTTHDYGTLNLACGKGKTVLALKYIAWANHPALVVVNSTYLLEQWKNEIEKFLGITDVGIIQGKTIDWKGKPITLAMVHTLSNKRHLWGYDFRRWFGTIMYDEGHHMSAPMFAESARLFHGKRYSLTATPNRTDGLQAIYQYHLGEVIHSNLDQDLIPMTYFHLLNWKVPKDDYHFLRDVSGAINSSKIKVYLGTVHSRNARISMDVAADMRKGRTGLVLTHSIEHANRMHELLKRKIPETGKVTGETLQEERVPTLEGTNPTVGTFQLAREGLNKPSLDTLYILTTFANSNDLQQSWGRIQRLYDDKKRPVVRVYIDADIKQSMNAMHTLKSFLKGLGYPHKTIKVNL